MKTKPKLKSFPVLKTDKEAEDFVRDVDLSEYDLSGFKPMKFEFSKFQPPTDDGKLPTAD